MYNIFLHGNNNPQRIENIFFVRLVDIFHQDSFAELNSENTKLRTYKLIKPQIGREPYLDKIRNIQDRISLTKFRLSNHSLMIEKGRHQNIDRNLRFCPFCPDSIEDEIHFIIRCKCFKTQRVTLYETVMEGETLQNFLTKSDVEKFKILLTDIRILPFTAKYLTQTFHAREFLIANHKNNI